MNLPNSNTIPNNQKKSSINFEMMKKPTFLTDLQSPVSQHYAGTFQKFKKETLSKIHNKVNIQDYLKDYSVKEGKKAGEDAQIRLMGAKPKLDTGIAID